ncbi:hypothetical protein B0H11DRAFT_2316871 [Mycena galericulata]|nr:hypothetical protein B0H11DRAFT_2316871 [Mycena galericulata]
MGMGSTQSYGTSSAGITERQQSKLSADELWTTLKSSQDIPSDIDVSSALQRLTEISTGKYYLRASFLPFSNADRDIGSAKYLRYMVIAREAGDYVLATSMTPPEHRQVYETLSDPLQKAIIEQTLNTKEPFYCDDASLDPKFSAEAVQSAHRSIICLPIRSNHRLLELSILRPNTSSRVAHADMTISLVNSFI